MDTVRLDEESRFRASDFNRGEEKILSLLKPLTSPYSPSPKGDATRTGILRQALASPFGRRGDAARTGMGYSEFCLLTPSHRSFIREILSTRHS